jgi:hypothetical protein
MLAKFNKKKLDNEKSKVRAWRVDFRNISNLPDIKTVRTGFAVSASIMAVIAFILVFGINREINVANLASEIADLDKQIVIARAESERAQKLFRDYQVEERLLKEVIALYTNKFEYVNFMLYFSKLIPQGAKVKRIEFRADERSLSIQGEYAGSDVTATEKAGEFISMLKKDSFLGETVADVSMPKLVRDTATDSLNYELIFKLK